MGEQVQCDTAMEGYEGDTHGKGKEGWEYLSGGGERMHGGAGARL